MNETQDTYAVRASRFVEVARTVYGNEFCDTHCDEIADIIFHAVKNWVTPTISCDVDQDFLAWDYIVQHIRDILDERQSNS